MAGSQYDTTRAMQGVKRARTCRNRLGFYSCVSCVHTLHCIVSQASYRECLEEIVEEHSIHRE